MTFKPAPPFRQATPGDAGAMAELVNFASEGMAIYLWTRMAEAGESPWDIGRQRAQRDSGGFSYRNTVLREHMGKAAAALIGYPLPFEPEPVNYDEMPAMFVPLQQLEDLVAGTWYVNVLATYPEYRGKGFGSGLLDIAETLAEDAGRNGLSIIVSDANDGARRLYGRQGYREAASRPMVKEGWENRGDNWVLLRKDL